MKSLARVLMLASELHDAIEQLQRHKFFAGHGYVGTVAAFGSAAEEVPRLVNGLGPACQDQRPLVTELVSVRNQFVRTGAMNLHAGYEEHLRWLAVHAHFA